MNLLTELIFPWTLLNCFRFFGGGMLMLASPFLGSTSIPILDTMKPSNFIKVTPKAHFEV